MRPSRSGRDREAHQDAQSHSYPGSCAGADRPTPQATVEEAITTRIRQREIGGTTAAAGRPSSGVSGNARTAAAQRAGVSSQPLPGQG